MQVGGVERIQVAPINKRVTKKVKGNQYARPFNVKVWVSIPLVYEDFNIIPSSRDWIYTKTINNERTDKAIKKREPRP